MEEPSPPFSLYFVSIPQPPRSVLATLFLGGGLVVSFSISFVLGLGFLISAAEAAGLPVGIAVTLGLCVSCAGPVLWTLAYGLLRRRRALATTPFRDSRLQRIVHRPDAMQRTPHRCLEYRLRHANSLRALRRAIRQLPGDVFVLAHRDDDPIPPPFRTSQSFEPIEVDSRDLQAQWLLLLAWPDYDPESGEIHFEDDDDAANHQRKPGHPWIVILLSYVGFAVGIGYMLHALITHDPESLRITIVLLGCVALTFIARLVRERRWWVIPGGVVERDAPFWHKAPILRRANAGESPLVIDQRFNLAYVVHNGKIRRIPCQAYGQWLLLAAWVNLARRPTDDELRAYFEAVLK